MASYHMHYGKLAETYLLPSIATIQKSIIATPTYGTDREKDSKNVPNSR